MSDPAVKSLNADTGGGAENRGQMEVELKPFEQRKVTVYQVIERLRPKLAVIPGATLFLRPYQDITVGGRISSSQYQYTLTSENLVDLLEWSPRVEAVMRQLPELSDISSDQQTRGLQATLVIDRDTASRLGISPQAIDNTLYDAFGQRRWTVNPQRGIVSGQLSALIGAGFESLVASPDVRCESVNRVEFDISAACPVRGTRGHVRSEPRHCEPTGRANARPMTGSAKQSIVPSRTERWIASLRSQ
jgi:hypothetical protein